MLLLSAALSFVQPPPLRDAAGRSPLRRGGQLAMGSKSKSAFTPYAIQGVGSDIFPLPDVRDAIQVHKKHRGAGCTLAKAPGEALPPLLNSHDFPAIKVIHLDPPVFVIDGFWSAEECDAYRALADDETKAYMLQQSATFSAISANARTSTTWFVRYQDAPGLVGRAATLLGSPVDTFEEPQLVRYQPGQRFTWHYDAVPPTMLNNGGQRLATLLVYLNDVATGGRTAFRDLRVGGTDSSGQPLRLDIEPKKGRALLWPSVMAHDHTMQDGRTFHQARPVLKGTKYAANAWIHVFDFRKPNLWGCTGAFEDS